MPTSLASRRVALAALLAACARAPNAAPDAAPAPRAQNPSPMVETTRAHARLPQDTPPGVRATLDSILDRPVELFVPERWRGAAGADLVIHFHGAAFISAHAAAAATRPAVVATVNLGVGGGLYDRAFAADPARFDRLVAAAHGAAERGAGVRFDSGGRVVLSAFSAGYGAVRAILRDEAAAARVGAVLLLDGLHASYVPERTPLAEGGALDTAQLAPFVAFARRAAAGEAAMLVTHSEIFPGTFASTTETTDHLLRSLGLTRTPVLAWGPGGMQQLSEARAGALVIQGFAGNTAPDHVDHLHGMPEFLKGLRE